MVITTFVLVPGSWCASAAWAPVARELTLRGHRAVPVDLPGHGPTATIPRGYLGRQDLDALATEPSGMAGVGTADDVALVTDVLRRAQRHGPAVLVGHSRGGLTLTAVANTLPELVDRLVYVSAWCCVTDGHDGYAASPENAGSELGRAAALAVADPAALGALRFNWRTADPVHLDVLQEVLLADGTRRELIAYLHAMDPDESLSIDDAATRADPATWGRIPRTYVRLTEDRAMPTALQDRFVAEADAAAPDNPFDVHSLSTSHLGVQVRPAGLVQILDGCTR